MTEQEKVFAICDHVHRLRRDFDCEGLRMSFGEWKVRLDNDDLQIEHGTLYQPSHRLWDFMLMPQVPA